MGSRKEEKAMKKILALMITGILAGCVDAPNASDPPPLSSAAAFQLLQEMKASAAAGSDGNPDPNQVCWRFSDDTEMCCTAGYCIVCHNPFNCYVQ